MGPSGPRAGRGSGGLTLAQEWTRCEMAPCRASAEATIRLIDRGPNPAVTTLGRIDQVSSTAEIVERETTSP